MLFQSNHRGDNEMRLNLFAFGVIFFLLGISLVILGTTVEKLFFGVFLVVTGIIFLFVFLIKGISINRRSNIGPPR